MLNGGEGGIRTLGTAQHRTLTFQASTFNHSVTSPNLGIHIRWKGGNFRGCGQLWQCCALRKQVCTGRVSADQGGKQQMTIRLNTILTLSFLLMFLAACATTPQAETWVQETNSLAYVVEDAQELAKIHGAERVLVVFDIDNTLMAMEQGLGSDQWYDWQSKLQLADPCDARLVSDRLAVQGALYYVSAMRPTQADAAQLVQALAG